MPLMIFIDVITKHSCLLDMKSSTGLLIMLDTGICLYQLHFHIRISKENLSLAKGNIQDQQNETKKNYGNTDILDLKET